MADDFCEIDLAMNMIKENITKELSESISKQRKVSYFQKKQSNNLSFSEKTLD